MSWFDKLFTRDEYKDIITDYEYESETDRNGFEKIYYTFIN